MLKIHAVVFALYSKYLLIGTTYPLLKISLGNPYLKIIDLSKLFVEDVHISLDHGLFEGC